MKSKTCFTAIAAVLLLACVALGAPEERKMERNVMVQRSMIGGAGIVTAVPLEGPIGGPVMGDHLMFIRSEMAFDLKVVKGVPYQAEAVSEHVQVLADGNRISRKDVNLVYRDSEGRTRREQTISAVGPWTPGGNPHRTVFINDPVEDVNYILNPDTRTARKVFASMMKLGDKLEVHAKIEELKKHHPGERVKVEIKDGVESVEVLKREGPDTEPGDKFNIALPGPNARTEQLGRRNIQGVEADGSRTIVTIAAGEIGNERPIEIVTENWYSPDLQVVIMSRHSDPRLGEDTYRLANIQRIEPSLTLFQVPADYTIQAGKEVIHELMKLKGDKK